MNTVWKELVKAIKLSLIIFGVILLLRYIFEGKIEFNQSLLYSFFYCMLYGISLYTTNTLIYIYLDRFFKHNKYTSKRIIIGFVSSLIASLLIIFLLRVFEDVVMEGSTFEKFLANESPKNYLFAITITIIVLLTVYLFYFYKAISEERIKEQKLIAGTANAKFESLKNQIDPHFLFNSLNVLSSLIEENPDNAQRFTTSLSKIYRYVLEQKDKELVSVEEELAFAKTYMNLLKMRFENSITFQLPESTEVPEAKVVPLSLQLLLENCIKHNTISEQKPLHIKIYIQDGFLVVENNLQKKEVLKDRQGVGLQNIVNRYALLSARNVLVENTQGIFKVKIPILTKQIHFMETPIYSNADATYFKAKDRVEKLKGFYGNLISYCTVIPVLIIINLNTSNYQWFWYPMLGWGFGVVFHAIETFGFGKSWEEKKIQELMGKQQDTTTKWD
ncbi:2TM domain-containing protein [Flavobacterium croceum]|uniref:2TM domain-containing protein n=1 Tax=Flavobacterium croceum TaxID=370975 RepID=UPI0024A85793|nr:2TM domain-containing protein [Flavobacterium croceum]